MWSGWRYRRLFVVNRRPGICRRQGRWINRYHSNHHVSSTMDQSLGRTSQSAGNGLAFLVASFFDYCRTWNTRTEATFQSQRFFQNQNVAHHRLVITGVLSELEALPPLVTHSEVTFRPRGTRISASSHPDRALAAPARTCPTKGSVSASRWRLHREL